MTKQEYLKRFSQAARWHLPPAEAAEAVADYAELLEEREEESLLRDLGDPAQAACLLAEPREYRCWLIVFVLMAFCLALPTLLLLRAQFHQGPEALAAILFVVGAILTLVWFRPKRSRGSGPLPRGLAAGLLLLLAGVLTAMAVLWGLTQDLWEIIPPRHYGTAARWALWLTGLLALLLGAAGLVRARTEDRRWRALYILALTAVLECVLIMALLTGMSLDASSANWWVPYAVRSGLLAGAGLAVTGVSLC